MNAEWFELFSNKTFWDEKVEEYLRTGFATGKTKFTHLPDLWHYFKYCLATENRFFFKHPLLETVKEKIREHEVTLPKNTTIFRARIDKENRYHDLIENYLQLALLEEQLMRPDLSSDGEQHLKEMIDKFSEKEEYTEYLSQLNQGFEGFDKEDSDSPPAEKASAGRCNPNNVSVLYASHDMHTAVAEVRPYISDTISIARLKTKKDLRLVDFYSDGNRDIIENDWLFWAISCEFSNVNKGNEHEYFATQYLTMLIKELGFDGIQFKSSLVFDGKNYVIFNSDAYNITSSKLYYIPEVKYSLMPFVDK